MISGLEISSYRSIGAAQKISPLGKINVFVGANNSGKSNILRFVYENLASLIEAVRKGVEPQFISTPHVKLGIPTAARLLLHMEDSADLASAWGEDDGPSLVLASKVFPLIKSDNDAWIDSDWPSPDLVARLKKVAEHSLWKSVWSAATKQSGGGLSQHWIPETLRRARTLFVARVVYSIPVERRADSQGRDDDNSRLLGGRGVVRVLAAMQSPRHATYEDDRKRFKGIENFVRTVTDDPSAEMIPRRK